MPIVQFAASLNNLILYCWSSFSFITSKLPTTNFKQIFWTNKTACFTAQSKQIRIISCVYISQGWNPEDLVLFIKKMKSLNLTKNVEAATFVMFPSKLCEELMLKQMQMAVKTLKMVNDQELCYIAYYNNKSVLPKG